MRYLLKLEDPETGAFRTEKTAAYAILHKLQRNPQFEAMPPLPEPLVVIKPQAIERAEDSEAVRQLSSELEAAFEPYDVGIVAIRFSSHPLKDGAPSYRFRLGQSDWKDTLPKALQVFSRFASDRPEYLKLLYAHPWKEPPAFVASADIITRLSQEKVTVRAGYGAGTGLELGGQDVYVFNSKTWKLIDKSVPRKERCRKVVDHITGRSGLPGGSQQILKIPEELQRKEVLPIEAVKRLARTYAPFERVFEYPVRIHWTTADDGEHTIDFQLSRSEFFECPPTPYLNKRLIAVEYHGRAPKKISDKMFILPVGDEEKQNKMVDQLPSGALIISTGLNTSHPAKVAQGKGIYWYYQKAEEMPSDGELVTITDELILKKLGRK